MEAPPDLQGRLGDLRSGVLRPHLLELNPVVERPVVREGGRLGTILIEQDERVLMRRINATGAIGAFILLCSLGLSYLIASRFQKVDRGQFAAAASG